MAINYNKTRIHVEHLVKNYDKLEVLKDISTDIYDGEVVVVIGPSGSGKSTSCAVSTVLRNSRAATS